MTGDATGLVLGGCRLGPEIGRGGAGTVYRAVQLGVNRPVAVKVIAAGSGWAASAERFRREAEAAGALDHPNCLPVYGAGEEEGLLYLVMRLVNGPSLDELVAREGPLPIDRVIALLEQVAAAVDHAHRAGFVHRDLKPANILIEPDGAVGHAFVSDFGLMRGVDDPAITLTGQWVGTPAFAAPEQLQGAPVGPAADIYALGGVLAHAVGSPPPPALAPVLDRARAFDPAERFATAGALAAATRAAVGTAGGRPRPEESGPATQPYPGPDTPATQPYPRPVVPSADPPPGRDGASTTRRSGPPPTRRRVPRAAAALLAMAVVAAAAVVIILATSGHGTPGARTTAGAPTASTATRGTSSSPTVVTTATITTTGTGPTTTPSSATATAPNSGSTPPAPRPLVTATFAVTPPRGWVVSADDVAVSGFHRTIVQDPNSSAVAYIDRSPAGTGSIAAAAAGVEAATRRTTPGYELISLQSRQLAGVPAVIWTFRLTGQHDGERVDVFRDLGDQRFGLLGCSTSAAQSRQVALGLATSLTTP